MSLPSRQIRCRGCDFEEHLIPNPVELHYHLLTGQVFKSHPTRVWCPHCDAITHAEDKLDEQALHLKLETLEKADRQRHGFWSNFCCKQKVHVYAHEHDPATARFRSPSLKEQIAAVRLKLQWVYLRKSESRCLSCGATGIVHLDFSGDENTIATHACGGELYFVAQDPNTQTWFHYPDEVIDLDVEGNLKSHS